MVPRFVGASLGLLAFTITIIVGLVVQNPVTVTLSRGILALVVFCVIGLVLGGAAQLVVNEYEKSRRADILERHRGAPDSNHGEVPQQPAPHQEGTPTET